MSKKDKLLNQYKSGYKKALTVLKDDPSDTEAARKIINLRILVARQTTVSDFEADLSKDKTFDDLPLSLLKEVEEIVKGINSVKAAMINAAKTVNSNTDRITISEFLEYLHWFECCNDMRTWTELDSVNDAFRMLKDLAVYYGLAIAYVEDWAAQIQKEIWDESGFYYTCEKTQVTIDENGDAPYTVREIWQQAYKILAVHAYEIHARMTSHTQVFDVPKYLIEDGKYYIKNK